MELIDLEWVLTTRLFTSGAPFKSKKRPGRLRAPRPEFAIGS